MHYLRAGLICNSLLDRRRASTYKELLQREERHSKLGSTVATMELEKAVMVRALAKAWVSLRFACSSHTACLTIAT